MTIYNIDIYDEGQSVGVLKRNGVGIDGDGLYVKGYGSQKELRVKSVSDMVTKILAATEGQKQKVDIFLNGEGGVNYQSVGAGTNRDRAGDRSIQLNARWELNDAAKTWLPRLIGKVWGIHLLGIDDGPMDANNKRSFPLLNTLASLLTGVHIYGHFGKDGTHIVYLGNSPKREPMVRTPQERQQLRDSLKKLDRI